MLNWKEYKSIKKCSLLGVGPMSLNCVDATIELANSAKVPLILIASRRQIDSESVGGGYVNNWNTQTFADHVRKNDTGGFVLLARDHGGPWQNTQEYECKLPEEEAMVAAEHSFREDIDAGFDMVHIDPSVDPNEQLTKKRSMERLLRLYEFCNDHAASCSKNIAFEIGTEEQSGSTNSPEELTETLEELAQFCASTKLKMPQFVVIQSGTRVKEFRNVGAFHSPLRIKGQVPIQLQVPIMVGICKKYGLMMKAHNCDYLSPEALKWHNRLGIDALNIAPEYGVTETKKLLCLLRQNNLDRVADEFLTISYESGKWEKWLVSDSSASHEDKAVMAGHYVFSNEAIKELINEASRNLLSNGIDLQYELKAAIKSVIKTHLTCLRIITPSYA